MLSTWNPSLPPGLNEDFALGAQSLTTEPLGKPSSLLECSHSLKQLLLSFHIHLSWWALENQNVNEETGDLNVDVIFCMLKRTFFT